VETPNHPEKELEKQKEEEQTLGFGSPLPDEDIAGSAV
jgi:hypothetical protein